MWKYNETTYIMHRAGHKYLEKHRGHNGKWSYVYPSETGNAVTNTALISAGKAANAARQQMINYAAAKAEEKRKKLQGLKESWDVTTDSKKAEALLDLINNLDAYGFTKKDGKWLKKDFKINNSQLAFARDTFSTVAKGGYSSGYDMIVDQWAKILFS